MDKKNNNKKPDLKKNIPNATKSNDKIKKKKSKTVNNQTDVDKKKRNLKIGISSACLVVVVFLAVFLPIILTRPRDVVFKIPALNLPIEEQYALQKYNYSDLSDTAVTIRNDVMNVTKRNLSRPKITEDSYLPDEFSLVYDISGDVKELRTVYGELVSPTSTQKTATIKFTDYPSPSHGVAGLGAYTDGTSNGTSISSKVFYKYMLMTQGQHLAMEAQQRSKDGTLTQEWLKKHKAADSQYGAVLGENNAVEKEITLDPIYRSFHTTGLYLPAGEVVKVKVEGLGEGERISITLNIHNSLAWRGSVDNDVYKSIVGTDQVKIQSVDAFFTKADIVTANGKFVEANVTNQSQWGEKQNNRMPWITADFVFDHDGEYNIGTPFGGVMHIDPKNCYSYVKTTITGAVETPHYILGNTTPEYFDKYLRNAPGVIAVLDTENGQLVSPTGQMNTTTYMRGVKTEEIDKLAMLWHSFYAVNESFTGGTYNRNNIVKFDQHVPAGAAVALGGYVYACPTSWFGGAMDYQGLLKRGTWGTLHEIGHNHGGSYGTIWGFGADREGEVRNNALTLLSYIMFCDVGTTIRSGGSAEHGAYANPYSTLSETLRFPNQTHSDFDDGTYGYFQCLGMYANIMHAFGAEKFYELLYTYKANPAFIEKGTSDNRREDFNYRCATVFGMDFTNYFNKFYKANLKLNVYSQEQMAFMKNLPNYEPVANFYAGGIDGVKTAGDYLVNFGEDIVFDLKEKTISSFDTANKKGFEIVSVSQPLHGKIKNLEDGKYAYSFNQDYNGNSDEIKFKIKLLDGIVHEFTIYLRINYNSSKLTTYESFDAMKGGLTTENWQTIMTNLPNMSYTVSNNAYSYIPSYKTAKGWEVRTLDFYWKAVETGNVEFVFKQDDGLRFYFGEDFENLVDYGYYSTYSSDWTPENKGVKVYVEKDQFYAIRILNVNAGGTGSATIGYKYEGKNVVQMPSSEIYHPMCSNEKEYKTFVFEPKFIVSKKDNINLSTSVTDKNSWKIIEAPDKEYIHGGRTDVIERVEVEYKKDENGEFIKDEHGNYIEILKPYYIEVDKWTYLIDGDVGTIFHTEYGTNSIKYPTDAEPYKFVVDTGKIQQFNYFTITTRTGALSVSKITKYELQISSDGVNFTTISAGDELAYNKNVAMLKFDAVTGRYFRLLVKGSTGNNKQFVVIAELDAGIVSSTQKIVPATSSMLFTTDGWKNTNYISEEKSGYMMSNSKNQKLVFKFKGEDLAVYAAVGQGFGKADFFLDGEFYETYDFESSSYDPRKLVLNFEKMENTEHTLEIITKSSEKVMINLFGIPYTASLVCASNIYLEKALTISLIVFILLFVACFAFIMCLLFIPKFRKFMGDNKAIAALDVYLEKQKQKRKEKRAAKKEEKLKAKENGALEEKKNKSSSVVKKSDAKPVSKTETKVSATKTETKYQLKPKTEKKAETETKSKTTVVKATVNANKKAPASKTNEASKKKQQTKPVETKKPANTKTKK